jgi:oligoribonuclease
MKPARSVAWPGGGFVVTEANPRGVGKVGRVSDRLVWIDCEMTGLDPRVDALVEVAALVTDFELNVLGEGVDLIVRPPDEALAQMDDFVRDMHTTSGLLDQLAGGTTLADAEAQVLDYVRAHCSEGTRPPLAGNSVGTDRLFISRDMPQLDALLHYRVVDVSSIKELARHWYPRAYFAAPAKRGNHRALADIRESIEELRYYRAAVFAAPPGPTSEQAKELAKVHGGSLTGISGPEEAAVGASAQAPPPDGEVTG